MIQYILHGFYLLKVRRHIRRQHHVDHESPELPDRVGVRVRGESGWWGREVADKYLLLWLAELSSGSNDVRPAYLVRLDAGQLGVSGRLKSERT